MDKLRRNPRLHDKVEFDILYTCFTFDFDHTSQELLNAGFSIHDVSFIRDCLLQITRNGIARCDEDVARMKQMEDEFRLLVTTDCAPLEKVYLLLKSARNAGVPCFSHLARNAFVAVVLLNSLRSMGCISSENVKSLYDSVRTVSSAMQDDAMKVLNEEMTREDFIWTYGHLRPGSYNILSPCYKNASEELIRPLFGRRQKRKDSIDEVLWDDAARSRVNSELHKYGFCMDVDQLIHFMRTAIEGRELGKFIFTKYLSAALESIAECGERIGLSRDRLAHIRIDDLLALRHANVSDLGLRLKVLSEAGEEQYDTTQAAYLPNLLFSASDFICSEQFRAEPNYVTQKKVGGQIVLLSKDVDLTTDLASKIVAIPSADPGYDWLFFKGIAGLITMYGGVNSHMSVRAAEHDVPAAIGVGEVLFEQISQASIVELDCASRAIRVGVRAFSRNRDA
jgi:phosphohistidine swiveling domain-containing protein